MSDTEALLISLDPKIDTAVATGDAATLNELLADDFIYTHSNGRHQPKDEYIDAIVQRENRPRRDLLEIEAEVHDDVAVTRGNLDIVYYDDRAGLFMRYVRVWRLKDDKWRAISHRTLYAKDRNPESA